MRLVGSLLLGVSSIALLASGVLNSARAQSSIALDPITVVATKTPETTTQALAAVSSIQQEQIQQFMPGRLSTIFSGMPGVWFQERGDDQGTAINIRGLQDFGRIAVLIDGARQNFQRTGHNADGLFYFEPELLAAADVVRGPVSNIYGSGAIGGVVSMRTKDVDDILAPGQNFGIATHGMLGTNTARGLTSAFAAARQRRCVYWRHVPQARRLQRRRRRVCSQQWVRNPYGHWQADVPAADGPRDQVQRHNLRN